MLQQQRVYLGRLVDLGMWLLSTLVQCQNRKLNCPKQGQTNIADIA